MIDKVNLKSRVEMVKLMTGICKTFGIVLVFKQGDEMLNRSYCAGSCGSSEIFIGVYDNPELELISFFHEFAHCLEHDFDCEHITKMQNELHITSEGLKLALNNYGIVFSGDAVKWMIDQCLTYYGWEEREFRTQVVFPSVLKRK